MIKYFVVSDVHSYFTPMMKALTDKGFDMCNKDHKVIICGDLFDRGPETIECFQFAETLAKEDRLVYVCGNHEDLLFQAYSEIIRTNTFSDIHRSNGTMSTIEAMTGYNFADIWSGYYDLTLFIHKMKKYLNFIADNTVDYFEVGDYVFVHGWIPSNPNWKVGIWEDDGWKNGDWTKAKWVCGPEEACWKGNLIKDKTIVCGHWHTSFAHYMYGEAKEEWGPLANFEPFYKEGIIAIDACTAYTGKVNCIVIEEN